MNSQRHIAPPKPVSVYPQPIQQSHPNQNQIKTYVQQPQTQHHQHQQHLPPSQNQYLPQQHKQHHANIAVHQTPSPLDGINMQLQHIERVNRELLGVAEKIRALGIGQNTNIPAVDRLQTEMRQSLNQLIQYIMQFHTDIDSKLKNLGIFITTQLQKKQSHIQTTTVQAPHLHHQEKQDKKYEILAQRIQNLELSLNQTQQNEKKLIQVIENMMERYQINDQPTLIRQNPGLNSQFRRNRIATTSCANIGVSNLETGRSLVKEERQKRVSPMPNNNFGKIQMKNKSIYENLYTIEQSVVNQQKRTEPNYFRLRQIQQQPQQQVYIKRLYSKYPIQQPPQHQLQLKRSLRGQAQHGHNVHTNMSSSKNYQNEIINKQQRSTASQASSVPQDDKQHRFNFMLGKLNM